MPLDPQVQALIEQMQASEQPALSDLGTAGARALLEQMAALAPEREPVAEVRDLTIPGPGAEIPIRVYRPASGTLPGLVWFHGGGWVIGNLETTDPLCRSLATRAGCLVISVDYRLAPEHRFPAAVEDAYAATRWVAEHGPELGLEAERLAVGGDSAGGNLAAVVALLARVKGPRLAYQLLIYPATDLRGWYPSYEENGEGYLLTERDMRWFESNYLGADADRDDPRVSPLRAPSHAGLPPALVVTAEYDPLRDQGEAYGEKLRAAGVPAEVRRYPGMIHAFLGLPVDRARIALQEIADRLRSALAAPPEPVG
ncbi:MAG TPA: alpha/beta hydrolase [Candidatus Dormibacteraeota bacterium]|nr:alpha/beta hydrolase [Candidatus Dormibacteraeota bacterium]